MLVLKRRYATVAPIDRQRDFFDWIAKKLNLQKFEDWYNVVPTELRKVAGHNRLQRYLGTMDRTIEPLAKQLAIIYPEHYWEEWKFKHLSESSWRKSSLQRDFFEQLAKKIGIKQQEDWFSIKPQQIIEHGGEYFLKYCQNSILRLLQNAFPEYDWPTKAPKEYWENKDIRMEYIEFIGKKLSVKYLDDCDSQFIENGGAPLINYYGSSMVVIVMDMYPFHPWKLQRFQYLSEGFWKEAKYQREFFENASKKLGIKSWEDWHYIKISDILKLSGSQFIISYYSNSLSKALTSVYPEHPWRFKKWVSVPQGFWLDKDNHRKFFENLGKRMGVKEIEDWYTVTAEDVTDSGGSTLVNQYYGGSLLNALSSIFPEHDWKPWRFVPPPQGLWKDREMHRQFFDWAGNYLRIKSLDDWYFIPFATIKKLGGDSLIREQYDGSYMKAFVKIYPNHPWKLYKFQDSSFDPKSTRFEKVPNNYWEEDSNVMETLRLLEKKLEVQHLNDWMRIPHNKFVSLGLATLLLKHGGISGLLSKFFPEHNWVPKLQLKGILSKAQEGLFKAVTSLFPGEDIHLDYLHPELEHQASKKLVQLDIFIPSLKLAFEYQGQQHYKDFFLSEGNNVERQKIRDNWKVELCKSKGITLIEVPYWWDRKLGSLAASIAESRQDLNIKIPKSIPIPIFPPK